jgi:anti-sigma factor RsiW
MAITHPETALVPYIRGELEGAERERVASHLAGCAQCRESAQSFHSLLGEVANRIDELPTPEWNAYRAELRRKLAARGEPRQRWWMPGFVWGGLGLAVAAALALWLTLPGHETGSAPAQQLALEQQQLALEQQMDVADVGLLRNYPVVQRLDLLENYDVIEHLDELRPAGAQPSNAVRS